MVVGLVGAIGAVIVRSCDNDTDYYVSGAEVALIERAHAKASILQGR